MPGKSRKFGKAVLELSLNDKISKGLKAMEAKIGRIGAAVGNIGRQTLKMTAGILGPLAAATGLFAKMGDSLDKMAGRTGISTELLSALGFASEQTGQDVATLEKSLSRMQRSLFDAGRGLATPIDALEKIGLRIEDLEKLKPDEQFIKVAEGISKIEDPTVKAGVAMSIFGQAGRKMLPLLSGGAAGIAAFVAEAESLGIVMSQEDATAAAELTDALNRLKRQVTQIVVSIGAAVAGPLTDFLESTRKIGRTVIDWVNDNRELIRVIGLVGVIVAGVGGTLLSIGIAFNVAAFSVGGLASAVGLVVSAIGALLSPLGIVTAGLTALATWFATSTETGRQFVDTLVTKFGELFSIAKDTFAGIADALAMGDIEAAGKVLWAGLQLMFLEGTAGLRDRWHALTGELTKLWHSTWAGMVELGNSAFGNIERGWSHTVEFIGNLWDTVVGGMQVALNELVGFFIKAWAFIRGASEEELARIDATTAAANAALAGDRRQRIDERSGAGAAEREQSRQLQAAALNEIGKTLAKQLAGTDSGTSQAIKEAAQALDNARSQFASQRDAVEKAVQADTAARSAIPGLAGGDVGAALSSVGSVKPQAILDASFAGQQFGQGKEEIDLLTAIKESNQKIADKKGCCGVKLG